MSFGYSVGDFVLCAQLAHRVWRECRDAPEDFRAVSTEVASLQLVLKEVQAAVHDQDLSLAKQQDLKQLVGTCTEVLQELEGILTIYKSLGTQSKRTWDRLRWSKDHVESIRLRVISNNSLLTSFNVGLLGAGQARIEKLLQQLVAEHQSGLREESIISNLTIESAEDGDEAAWCQIDRELEDVGITSTLMQENRAFIIAWIKSALASGQLEERACLPEMDPTVLSQEESGSRPNGDLNIPAIDDPVWPYTYEGREGSLVTSPDRWTKSQLEDLQEICRCDLQPPQPSTETDPSKGYFVATTGLSLFVVQAYLGPNISIQSSTHQGREGSLVTSPYRWTKSRIGLLQELCRHSHLQALEKGGSPHTYFFPGYGLFLSHVQSRLGPQASIRAYKHQGLEGTLITSPCYLTTAQIKDLERLASYYRSMSPSTAKMFTTENASDEDKYLNR